MKNIIVTGGLGFIGSHLVKLLNNKKYNVIVLDNFSYSSNRKNLQGVKNIKILKVNICEKRIVTILNKFKPIAIFNLAAETHVDRSIDDPSDFIFSNIVGCFNLLECTKKFLKKNKIKNFKFIHISTDEVYGDIEQKKFSKENDPFKPNSPYAASKASSDLLIRSYFKTYKLPLIVTNCSNNFGPNQFPEKLIPKMINNIIRNKNLPIYGNGLNEREWIYVKDHCLALYKILKSGKAGKIYNIGSGKILTNKFIISMILDKMKKIGFGKKSKIINVTDRPAHDKRYALNSNKIRKELNWKPNFKFTDAISETITWYINNKKWLSEIKDTKYKKRLGLKS
jgi:dTDP-glucose 4,6-dehydratase